MSALTGTGGAGGRGSGTPTAQVPASARAGSVVIGMGCGCTAGGAQRVAGAGRRRAARTRREPRHQVRACPVLVRCARSRVATAGFLAQRIKCRARRASFLSMLMRDALSRGVFIG